eukprot:TRINITY_DN1287_c0_g1_i1.p1 TRINITY_DN1287_c0_g1~~TRINITY_DN1287_c0_g1_i1.p1  ORF type:complete len:187 (+),score=73.47 TRINITY_DN1287_c0_g1_i1:271-831(+)
MKVKSPTPSPLFWVRTWITSRGAIRKPHVNDWVDIEKRLFGESGEDEQKVTVDNSNKAALGGFEDKMSSEEACSILGLTEEEGADPKKVQAAHRRVILRNHPDRGGSPFMATKINEAKDRLSKLTAEDIAKAKKEKERKAKEAKEAKEAEEAASKTEENTETDAAAETKKEVKTEVKKKKKKKSLF